MANRRTYRGKMIDMDALQRQNEKSTALGNMGVNAKGDKLGSNGQVVEPANSRTRKHYNTTRKTVNTKGSLKSQPAQEEEKVFDEPKEEKTAKKTKTQSPKKTEKSKKEVEQDNGDIVIEDNGETSTDDSEES